jgi:CheY-like chemotaxis protein
MPQCLLIDRNAEERSKTAKLLGEMGFQVSELADAREALKVGLDADAVVLSPAGQGLSASDFVRLFRRQDREGGPQRRVRRSDAPVRQRSSRLQTPPGRQIMVNGLLRLAP